MIYCFKKLRELRLTHIFFLHYSISLLIGGAAIAGLILLGVTGIVQPTVSALLHNASTLMISLGSMKNLLDENKRTELE